VRPFRRDAAPLTPTRVYQRQKRSRLHPVDGLVLGHRLNAGVADEVLALAAVLRPGARADVVEAASTRVGVQARDGLFAPITVERDRGHTSVLLAAEHGSELVMQFPDLA